MKEKIEQLIKEKPKHFSKMIQSNPTLKEWVLNNFNSSLTIDSFVEKIYSSIHLDKTNTCKHGNRLKFVDIYTGWTRGCLQCAAEAKSIASKTFHTNKTQEQVEEIRKKREETNLKKYGVANVGQTNKAKAKHQEFYADKEKVANVTAKSQQTCLERYGVSSSLKLPEIRQEITKTNLERYGVKNPLQLPKVKQYTRERNKKMTEDKEWLQIGYNLVKKNLKENANFTLLTPFEEYQGIKMKDAFVYLLKCDNCGYEFEQKIYHIPNIKCPSCSPKKIPSYCSNEEISIVNLIEHFSPEAKYHQSDKRIILPYELDIVLSDLKVAIEYCGLYWHSYYSLGKKAEYHQTKTKRANDKGFHLITIFSDENNRKNNAVIARIKDIVSPIIPLPEETLKIEKLTDENTINSFLDEYSLSLDIPDEKVVYGAWLNNQLVATVSLTLNKDTVDIVDFSTSGISRKFIFPKFIEHIKTTLNPEFINFCIDLRWENPNDYLDLGFSCISDIDPVLWLVIDYEARVPQKEAKKIIKKYKNDPNKICEKTEFDCIWDCGHKLLQLNIKN